MMKTFAPQFDFNQKENNAAPAQRSGFHHLGEMKSRSERGHHFESPSFKAIETQEL